MWFNYRPPHFQVSSLPKKRHVPLHKTPPLDKQVASVFTNHTNTPDSRKGVLVTEVWIGNPSGSTARSVRPVGENTAGLKHTYQVGVKPTFIFNR